MIPGECFRCSSLWQKIEFIVIAPAQLRCPLSDSHSQKTSGSLSNCEVWPIGWMHRREASRHVLNSLTAPW